MKFSTNIHVQMHTVQIYMYVHDIYYTCMSSYVFVRAWSWFMCIIALHINIRLYILNRIIMFIWKENLTLFEGSFPIIIIIYLTALKKQLLYIHVYIYMSMTFSSSKIIHQNQTSLNAVPLIKRYGHSVCNKVHLRSIRFHISGSKVACLSKGTQSRYGGASQINHTVI